MLNFGQFNELIFGGQVGAGGGNPPSPADLLSIAKITDHAAQAADRFAVQFHA